MTVDPSVRLPRRLARRCDAASPVIGIILMVAIVVVLAGIVYVWMNQLGPSENAVTYLTTQIQYKHTDAGRNWSIAITGAEGHPLRINNIVIRLEDESSTVVECADYFGTTSNHSWCVAHPPTNAWTYYNEGLDGTFCLFDSNGNGYLDTGDTLRLMCGTASSWSTAWTLKIYHGTTMVYSTVL